MVDLWCKSHRRAPKAITLDIDDTADTVHGHQQLSLFNAHYDERCFLPIHVYDAIRPLRADHPTPGKDTGWQGGECPSTPPGQAHVAALAEHTHHDPRRQPLRPTRGDGLVREQNRVHYIFGLSTNTVLAAQVFIKTDDVCVRTTRNANLDVVRDYTETRHRRQILVASLPRRGTDRGDDEKGLDTRYVVTNITYGTWCGSMTASTQHAGRQRT